MRWGSQIKNLSVCRGKYVIFLIGNRIFEFIPPVGPLSLRLSSTASSLLIYHWTHSHPSYESNLFNNASQTRLDFKRKSQPKQEETRKSGEGEKAKRC
jgi:hypothetical protein